MQQTRRQKAKETKVEKRVCYSIELRIFPGSLAYSYEFKEKVKKNVQRGQNYLNILDRWKDGWRVLKIRKFPWTLYAHSA